MGHRILALEVAERGRKLGQAEPAAALDRFAELLPPLCHEAVAPREEVSPARSRLSAAVRYGLEHLRSPDLRVLGYPDGVELNELCHPFRHLGVLDQSPPVERRVSKLVSLEMSQNFRMKLSNSSSKVCVTHPIRIPAWPVLFETVKSDRSLSAGEEIGVY